MVITIKMALKEKGYPLKEFKERLSRKTGLSTTYCGEFGFSTKPTHIPEKHRDAVEEILGSFGLTWDDIGEKELI